MNQQVTRSKKHGCKSLSLFRPFFICIFLAFKVVHSISGTKTEGVFTCRDKLSVLILSHVHRDAKILD